MKILQPLLLLLATFQLHAAVYTCEDSRGTKSHQQTACSGDTKYVRCTSPNGSSYLRKGTSCPVRMESVPQRAGMVTNASTGQQVFMVPGGGNGMIDPQTGQRHELTSPPPKRRVKDTAEPVSAAQVCAEEKARYDQAQANFNRTMTSIRSAQARYERICGK